MADVRKFDERCEKSLRDAYDRMKRRSDAGEWTSESVFYVDLGLALDELVRLRTELIELQEANEARGYQ